MGRRGPGTWRLQWRLRYDRDFLHHGNRGLRGTGKLLDTATVEAFQFLPQDRSGPLPGLGFWGSGHYTLSASWRQQGTHRADARGSPVVILLSERRKLSQTTIYPGPAAQATRLVGRMTQNGQRELFRLTDRRPDEMIKACGLVVFAGRGSCPCAVFEFGRRR
jgi:hypothetical protein